MGRRASIIILLLLISGITVLLFLFQQGRRNILTDPYNAIPVDACLVIESVNLPLLLNGLTEESGLFKELSNVKELTGFYLRLKYLSGLLNRNEYTRLFERNSSLISLQTMFGAMTGHGRDGFTFTISRSNDDFRKLERTNCSQQEPLWESCFRGDITFIHRIISNG